jgi:hypothetical protein
VSNAFKWFGLFIKDHDRLDRWMRFYIHHRNLYAKGQGEAAAVKSLVSLQALMLTWLFLKTTFPFLETWMFFTFAPFLVAFKIGFHWWLGYWWDVHNFYDRENDWGNQRNPIQKSISETLLNGGGITK